LTRAYWLEGLPGWVLYISLFNLSISNALGLYLSMIVFRRRYYELLLYALLNPHWQLHSAAYMALGNFYKTLLLGKLFMVLVNSQKLIYRFRLKAGTRTT